MKGKQLYWRAVKSRSVSVHRARIHFSETSIASKQLTRLTHVLHNTGFHQHNNIVILNVLQVMSDGKNSSVLKFLVNDRLHNLFRLSVDAGKGNR